MSVRKSSRIVRAAHAAVSFFFWLMVVLSVLPLIQLTQADPDDVAAVAQVAVPATLSLVLAAIVLHLVRRITGSIRSGDPFAVENVRRLRWIAVVTLTEPVQRVGTALLRDVYESVAHAARLGLSVSLSSIVFALCLFALAEVFAFGVRLREESEATI